MQQLFSLCPKLSLEFTFWPRTLYLNAKDLGPRPRTLLSRPRSRPLFFVLVVPQSQGHVLEDTPLILIHYLLNNYEFAVLYQQKVNACLENVHTRLQMNEAMARQYARRCNESPMPSEVSAFSWSNVCSYVAIISSCFL